MNFVSKTTWDTDINTVGGQSNVLLVDSPYSDHPAANASQGALTYGNLVNEFKPPKIEIHPFQQGYYIQSRMSTNAKNSAVDELEGTLYPNLEEPDATNPKKYVAPSRRRNKPYLNVTNNKITDEIDSKETPAAPASVESKEQYNEMPEFRGSQIHEGFKMSDKVSDITMGDLILILVVILILFAAADKIFNNGAVIWIPLKRAFGVKSY